MPEPFQAFDQALGKPLSIEAVEVICAEVLELPSRPNKQVAGHQQRVCKYTPVYCGIGELACIEKAAVLHAGEIVQHRALMSARDAVRIAVMERYGIRSTLSFDGDFDRWPGLQRIHRI